MKFILLLLVSLFIFSCGKDKVIQLPEISHSDISEINDVSAAYLFYDKNQPDSLELNRKNLISTTNWLVNVDKRLTLKQAIPKIKFLQDKKRNAEIHKNENAKNYYTCNDLSRKNLGFIEFTNIFYHQNKNPLLRTKGKLLKIIFFGINNISITTPYETVSKLNKANFITVLKKTTNKTEKTLICSFKEHLTFQDYILQYFQYRNR